MRTTGARRGLVLGYLFTILTIMAVVVIVYVAYALGRGIEGLLSLFLTAD